MKKTLVIIYSSLYYSVCKANKPNKLRILTYKPMARHPHAVLGVAAAERQGDRRPCAPLGIVPAQEQPVIVAAPAQIGVYGGFSLGQHLNTPAHLFALQDDLRDGVRRFAAPSGVLADVRFQNQLVKLLLEQKDIRLDVPVFTQLFDGYGDHLLFFLLL